MPKKAILYSRAPSRRHGDRRMPLRDQEKRCRAYAAQAGYTVAGVFTDAAVSDSGMDRPGLNALVQPLSLPGTDEIVVVVEDFSWLARDPEDFSRFLSRLREVGVAIAVPLGR